MASTGVSRIDGIDPSTAIKAPCRVATTANITLSGTQTIDGVAVVADDRVLVKDQTTTTDNGIWVVATSAWSRADDFNGTRDGVQGTMVKVNAGTANAGSVFEVTTTGTITPGTTAIAFGLAPGLSGTTNKTFDTAVVAAANTGLVTGEYVFTAGRSTIGDGGEGFYRVVAGGTGTNDGGSYINTSGGKQLQLLQVNKINPIRWAFDNTGATDNAAKLQLLIDYGLGREFHFTKGTYLFASAIDIDNLQHYLHISGEGVEATFFNFSSTTGNGFTLAEESDNTIIRDMHIKAATTSSGTAIDVSNTGAATPWRDTVIDNVNISNFQGGIDVKGGLSVRVYKGRISGSFKATGGSYGIRLGEATQGVNMARLDDVYVSGFETDIHVRRVQNCSLYSPLIGNAVTALSVESSSICHAHNVYFDSNNDTAIANAGYLEWSGSFSSLGTQLVTSSTKRIYQKGWGTAHIHVYANAGQNISIGLKEKIQFDNEEFDNESDYDNVTNHRFTARYPGFYSVVSGARVRVPTASVEYKIGIYVNGTVLTENQYAYSARAVPYDETMQVSNPRVWLDTGEYIEIFFDNTEGTGVATLRTGKDQTYLVIGQV